MSLRHLTFLGIEERDLGVGVGVGGGKEAGQQQEAAEQRRKEPGGMGA